MMAEWFLVILVYAGALSSGDSVALTQVPMKSEKACMAAAQKAEKPLSPGYKSMKAVCLKAGE